MSVLHVKYIHVFVILQNWCINNRCTNMCVLILSCDHHIMQILLFLPYLDKHILKASSKIFNYIPHYHKHKQTSHQCCTIQLGLNITFH